MDTRVWQKLTNKFCENQLLKQLMCISIKSHHSILLLLFPSFAEELSPTDTRWGQAKLVSMVGDCEVLMAQSRLLKPKLDKEGVPLEGMAWHVVSGPKQGVEIAHSERWKSVRCQSPNRLKRWSISRYQKPVRVRKLPYGGSQLKWLEFGVVKRVSKHGDSSDSPECTAGA